MRQLPKRIGIRRKRKSTRLHKEVVRNLSQISREEDKSFSWVLAEIVYAFFGLKISSSDVLRMERSIKTRVLRFEKKRKAS